MSKWENTKKHFCINSSFQWWKHLGSSRTRSNLIMCLAGLSHQNEVRITRHFLFPGTVLQCNLYEGEGNEEWRKDNPGVWLWDCMVEVIQAKRSLEERRSRNQNSRLLEELSKKSSKSLRITVKQRSKSSRNAGCPKGN